jgi:glycerate kinase
MGNISKIIVIPDSFKGSMSSARVCGIVAQAARRHLPGCEIRPIPVADGGEGTVDCFLTAVGGERVTLPVHGPFGETVEGFYALLPGGAAVIETAAAAGLPLAAGRLDPVCATTFGVGELIADALARGSREILLGLGGSCTNDAGAGMAAALGARFYDAGGHAFLPAGGTLRDVARIDAAPLRRALAGIRVTAMCDVRNPLYGPEGAAFVFAPQKGADPAAVERLDKGLRFFAAKLAALAGREIAALPGAGAAGGMGAGVVALLGGRLTPGIEAVLDTVGFDALIRGADLIVTGEGRVDGQSAAGKVVAGVGARAAKQGVPVVALTGAAGPGAEEIYRCGVTAVFPIGRGPKPLEEAMARGEENLAFTSDSLMRLLAACGAPRG